jgi:uncharacterized membrane protein HdeD (DUF308 family)
MSAASNASHSIAGFVRRSLGWSIALSILLIIAGIAAIIIPVAASVAVTIFVGWVLIFSGVVHLVYAWHTRGAGGIVWEVLLGLLYIAVGIYLLWNPILGMASLTLALGIYLFVEALLEFVLSYQLREARGWGWLLFDGIVTLVLAALIWMTWPTSSVWVLGTLVGVSMLFSGVARLMVSLTARKLMPAAI